MIAPNQPTPLLLGFLTVFAEPGGMVGGYLVTNSWGRPLEFRLSSAVQPNRIQQILYAETLTDYLCGELIARTLIEKTATPAGLVLVDHLPALSVRRSLEVPVVAVLPAGAPELAGTDPRYARLEFRGQALLCDAARGEDLRSLPELLERVDAGLDLAEPFQRVREAMGEARKLGGGRGNTQAA